MPKGNIHQTSAKTVVGENHEHSFEDVVRLHYELLGQVKTVFLKQAKIRNSVLNISVLPYLMRILQEEMK